MRWEGFRHNVNSDSGIVNTYSGKNRKAFTLNQNGCSRYAGISVHVEPEWVFMMGRNMQEPAEHPPFAAASFASASFRTVNSIFDILHSHLVCYLEFSN